AARFSHLHTSPGAGNAVAGLVRRTAPVTRIGYAFVLVARSRNRPFHHWSSELDRTGLRLQMDVVAPGGSLAPAIVDPLAGPAASMAFAIASRHYHRADRYCEY